MTGRGARTSVRDQSIRDGAIDPFTRAIAEVLAPVIHRAVADALAEHATSEPKPRLLTRQQLARELNVCAKTVARLEGEGLPVLHCAGSPRYELEAALAFLRGRGAR